MSVDRSQPRSSSSPEVTLETVLTLGQRPQGVLRAEERGLLMLIDGRRTVAELIGASGHPGFIVIYYLRNLLTQGTITVVQPPRTAQGSRTTLAMAPLSPLHPKVIAVHGEPSPPAAPPARDAGGRVQAPAAGDSRSTAARFHLGPYEVLLRIGQGAMGSLYLCRRAGALDFQRLYALKTIRQQPAEANEARRSMLREARVGALLSHPNLVNVHDVGQYQDNKEPYLVLDYIEGVSLFDLQAAVGPVRPTVVVSMMTDVLTALSSVHDRTDAEGTPVLIVHADIAPQNVILSTSGFAHLADFGNARFADDPLGATGLQIVAGRPSYLAPEQLMAEPLDARTDVYTMGVVMWTALIGQRLFAAESVEQTVINVLQARVDPPSRFGAPPELDEVCLRALSRSPDARYQSAEQMRQALLGAAHQAALLPSRKDVHDLVWQAAGQALEERRRRVALMPATVPSPREERPVETPAPDAPATADDRPPDDKMPEVEPLRRSRPRDDRAARQRRVALIGAVTILGAAALIVAVLASVLLRR